MDVVLVDKTKRVDIYGLGVEGTECRDWNIRRKNYLRGV